MTVSETQVAWLTQESYDRLKQELDELVGNRPVIAAKINDAREEGDLKENGGYHAAREEQAQLEGADPPAAGAAASRQGRRGLRPRPGSPRPEWSSRCAIEATTKPRPSCSARWRKSQHGDLEVYSPNSPLGKAIIGAHEGEDRHYELPNGGLMTVAVVKAEPFRG